MRWTIVSYGSEGDTRPFVALCRGLMDVGHEVLLLAEGSSLDSARRHGVPAQALGGDLQSILLLTTPVQAVRGVDLLKAVKASVDLVNGHAEAWMRAIAAHAQHADGVLYSSLAAHMGETVARQLGKPALGLWLQPTTPTRAFAAPTFSAPAMPGWLNRLSYHASPDAVVRRLCGRATRAAGRAVFGARAKLDSARVLAAAVQRNRMLYGFSRFLVERPTDWPAAHQICGHWPLPSSAWSPPEALVDFLERGAPPIYIGFGAMASYFSRAALDEIVTAVAGRRVVFYPGWSRVTADMLPENFFVLGDTPHDWLFPRVSAVVHHGGAGTTHTATRAGKPSIVVPVAVDQFFWARRLAALGVAPAYVRAARLDARKLTDMLEHVQLGSVRLRARLLGEALAQEDGVATAVRAIEAWSDD